MVKCKNCENIEISRSDEGTNCYWCEEVNDSPYTELERNCKYYQAMTNADRIRKMTDEELAGFITKDCLGEYRADLTKEQVVEWLQLKNEPEDNPVDRLLSDFLNS